LFLTLTVKNPKMENLREKPNEMSKAWRRFKDLSDWPTSGWLRATEVTKGQDGNPHPLCHVLMCVPSDYFTSGGYVNKERWLSMWCASMRDESIMKVDIRVVKPRAGTPVADTSKYVFKYRDLAADSGCCNCFAKRNAGRPAICRVAVGLPVYCLGAEGFCRLYQCATDNAR
jgi:plasmid rolling circle replication initiator protein Rep